MGGWGGLGSVGRIFMDKFFLYMLLYLIIIMKLVFVEKFLDCLWF